MKKVFVLYILLLGMINIQFIYANGPSISKTQAYIQEILNNRQKTDKTYGNPVKFNFTGTCKALYKHRISRHDREVYRTMYIELKNKHYFHLNKNVFVNSRDNIENVSISKKMIYDNTGKVKYRTDNKKSKSIHLAPMGIYKEKIKKAIEHLNTECKKLSTTKKELF